MKNRKTNNNFVLLIYQCAHFIKRDANKSSLAIFNIIVFTIILFANVANSQVENEIYGQRSEDYSGVSSLMSAISHNDIEGVKFFSRAGGFLINQQNIGGATSLHIAARTGNEKIVDILLENGADSNISDNEGYTPLMRAAISSNAKIIASLLGNKANPLLKNSNGETAIIHAALSDCFDCLNEIFTKSKIIKTADLRLLKEQLVDAFIVARNRENTKTQGVIEGYLDRINKMLPLIANSDTQMGQGDVQNVGQKGDYSTFSNTHKARQSFLVEDKKNGKVRYNLSVVEDANVATENNANNSSNVVKNFTNEEDVKISNNQQNNQQQIDVNDNANKESLITVLPEKKVITKYKFLTGEQSKIPASQISQDRIQYKIKIGAEKQKTLSY